MDRPRIYVDFNEMLEENLVLLSQHDTVQDSSGSNVVLEESMQVHIYQDDYDDNGNEDNLIADGIVQRNNTDVKWGKVAKWCCRIDRRGIRHESESQL